MGYKDFDFRNDKEKQRDRNIITVEVILFIIFIVIVVYVMFFADCSSLKWMPIYNLPNRCLDLWN